MGSDRRDEPLEQRSDLGAGYREDRESDGEPRSLYVSLLKALAGVELTGLQASVAECLERQGVSFGGESFVVDPVPRLITAEEWSALEAGLTQRTRALNRFLIDAYGEQRVVDEGIIAATTLTEAEGFEPDLLGRLPSPRWPAAIIGFDVVRDGGGEFMVLEDNLRTPSGFAYALAAREALLECLPPGAPVPRSIDPATIDLLASVMRGAAPAGVQSPTIVLLTDGPGNVAHYEHAFAAARLGARLATLDELAADEEGLWVHRAGEVRERVDVLYRRSGEDRVRDEAGRLTQVAAKLLPPWLAGTVGLVNAFGNGLADDKLVHAHVEDFIRFYLHEEPLMRSVPTRHVSEAPQETIAELERLVVKPRHGHGGHGVVIGPHADSEDLERLARELERRPERYISQPTVMLSRHPTVIDGQLEPRHVDLRPFAFAGETVALMPGGLSRVAFDPGGLVVNSSQNGGGKDTWVVDS